MSSALILAAGKATRLEGLRETYAKANVPIGGTTPLRFLLEALGSSYSELWINLHYKAEQVRNEAQRWAHPEVRLRFLEEPNLLGTGGTLLRLHQQHGVLPKLVVNAKMFTDFAFANLVDAVEGTLVLHPPSSLQTFGGLRFDQNLRFLGLHKRTEPLPSGQQAAVFTGIYRPHPHWLLALQQTQREHAKQLLCLIRDGLLPAFQADPDCVHLLLHQGIWCEMSTPERVAQAAAILPKLLPC